MLQGSDVIKAVNEEISKLQELQIFLKINKHKMCIL